MPSADLWEQYSIIGIIILVLYVTFKALMRFWNLARVAQEDQDKKRDSERERQRTWQAEQNALREKAQDERDHMWRTALEGLQVAQTLALESFQKAQTTTIAENTRVMASLVSQISALTSQVQMVITEIRTHDVWAREALSSPPREPRKEKSASPAAK